MPIEFRCPQCQKLLRVGDDAAGKQAKCPACATLVAVPTLGPPPADEFAIEPPSPPPPPTGSPFGTAGTNPFASAPLPQRLAPASDNPYAAPLTGGEAVTGFVNPSTIDVNGVFNVAWPVFKANMGMLIAVFFVQWIIGQAASFGGNILQGVLQAAGADVAVVVTVNVLTVVIATLIGLWLGSGQDMFFMQTAKGASPPFSLLFNGHSIMLRRLLFSLIAFVAAIVMFLPAVIVGGIVYLATGDDEPALVVGFAIGVICIFPWLWMALTFGQAYFAYVDQPVGVIEGLRLSARITPGNRLSLFAIGILAGLLAMVGACACGVGVFFTAPLAHLATIIAYLQMTGQPIRGYDTSVPSHMTV